MHKEWCNYLEDHFFRRVYRFNEFKRKLRNLSSFYQSKLFKPLIFHKNIIRFHSKYYWVKEKVQRGERITHSFTENASDMSIGHSVPISTEHILKNLSAMTAKNASATNSPRIKDTNVFEELSGIFLNPQAKESKTSQKTIFTSEYDNLKRLFQKKKQSHFELEKPQDLIAKNTKKPKSPKPSRSERIRNLKIIKPPIKNEEKLILQEKNELTLLQILQEMNPKLSEKMERPKPLIKCNKALKEKFSEQATATRADQTRKSDGVSDAKFKISGNLANPRNTLNFNSILKTSCSQTSELVHQELSKMSFYRNPSSRKVQESQRLFIKPSEMQIDIHDKKSTQNRSPNPLPSKTTSGKVFARKTEQPIPKKKDLKLDKPGDIQRKLSLRSKSQMTMQRFPYNRMSQEKNVLQAKSSLRLTSTSKQMPMERKPIKIQTSPKMMGPEFLYPRYSKQASKRIFLSPVFSIKKINTFSPRDSNVRQVSNLSAKKVATKRSASQSNTFTKKGCSLENAKKSPRIGLFDRKQNGKSLENFGAKLAEKVRTPVFKFSCAKETINSGRIPHSERRNTANQKWSTKTLTQKVSLNHLKKRLKDADLKTVSHNLKKPDLPIFQSNEECMNSKSRNKKGVVSKRLMGSN